MPRINDIMQPPPGTYGAPDTTIKSAAYNTFVDDMIADANNARPVSAGGTGAQTADAARTNLGVKIGTNVQAYDAGLQSIASLTTVADRMLYTTAADAYATTALTPFARTLLDDTDAAAMRATIGANNASNLTTGTVPTARLPTDLGDSKEIGAQLSLKAATAGNVNLWFDRGDDTHAGIIYFSDADDQIRLRTYAADGVSVVSQLTLECASANAAFNGAFSATSFAGDGSGLTALNAAQLTGTVPTARLVGTYNISISGNAATATSATTAATATSAGDADTLDGQHGAFYRNADSLNAGTVADARLPSTLAGKTFSTRVDLEGGMDFREPDGGVRQAAAGGAFFVQQLDGAGLFEENWLTARKNGAVELYHNGIKRFETTADGASIEGDLDLKGGTSELYIRRADGTSAARVYVDVASNLFVLRAHNAAGTSVSQLYLDGDAEGAFFNCPVSADSFSGNGAGLSSVDADALNGASEVADADTANSIVKRTAQGDVVARLLRSTYPTTISSIAAIMTQAEIGGTGNNYVRPSTPAQVAAVLPNIGWGQTWQDVTASRAGNTSYRNTTGRPIMVTATMTDGSQFEVSTNNSTWVVIATGDADQDQGTIPGGLIIPDNHYYKVTGGMVRWTELR